MIGMTFARGSWAAGLLMTMLMLPVVHAAPAIEVRDAALRAPRAGFAASVLTLTLRSGSDARLVAASSAAARRVELHRMVRRGSEVSMQPVQAVALPAGTEVALAMGEGRHHLMAGGFTRPLRGGERIDLRLVVENDRTHTRQVLRVRVPVVGTPGHAAHGEDDLH